MEMNPTPGEFLLIPPGFRERVFSQKLPSVKVDALDMGELQEALQIAVEGLEGMKMVDKTPA
jgi:hypothetical protein